MTKAVHDPFADALGYHLRRVSAVAMADLTRELAPLGLRPTDASVLFVIDGSPGVTQSEIGRTLGVKRANMAPLVAGLEQQDLIERQRSDGRSHGLSLTAHGATICAQARAAMDRHERRMFGSLDPQARRDIIARLHGIWSRGKEQD